LNYAIKILAVIKKDVQAEYRARYAVNSVLLFCVTSLAVVSFSLGGTVKDPGIQASLLWVILFFSAMMGLSRAFIKEQDRGTMNTLRLVCEPGQVFIGKMMMNFILLVVVMLIVTPLFIVLMNIQNIHVGYFASVMVLSAAGLSAVCTLLSAVVAQARARGTLFPVLAFPVLIPVFMVAVKATEKAISEPSPWANSQMLVFLGCYAVVSVIGGSYLFEYVFTE